MKNKLLLGIGVAAGYVLGSRSGRAAYDKIKSRAAGIWDSKPVQDKVAAATEAIKEKAPDLADQLGEAARRAGTVLGSVVQHDSVAGNSKAKTSDAGAPSSGPGASGVTGTGDEGVTFPAHGTRPGTANLGIADTDSDPARNDSQGQDWTDEGGATPAGAATNVDPRRD